MKTKLIRQAPVLPPPREPAASGNIELSQQYKAPRAEPAQMEMEEFVAGEEGQAKKDGETLLDLIVANAREGRWGHSKFKDAEKLKPGSDASPRSASMERSSSAEQPSVAAIESSRNRAQNSIDEARSEVALVASTGASDKNVPMESRLEDLAKQQSAIRQLMEHV